MLPVVSAMSEIAIQASLLFFSSIAAIVLARGLLAIIFRVLPSFHVLNEAFPRTTVVTSAGVKAVRSTS